MPDEPSAVAAGDTAGGLAPHASESPVETPREPSQPRRSIFDRRGVPPLSPQERAVRTDAIERSLQFGAEPVRDGRGWALEVDFIEANREAVEPWTHDRRDKRFYRRSQQVPKAAGQLIGQPGDRIELATRFARLHRREGSDVEGAVRRGLFDAIWRFDHVYDSYTVPRRYGTHIMKTGRVAAVAEEARRRWQAEGLAPADAFWVRNRRNTGLVLVSPNADPDAPSSEEFLGGEGVETVVGQGDFEEGFTPVLPTREPSIVRASGVDPDGVGVSAEPLTEEATAAQVRTESGPEVEVFALDPSDELELLRQLGVDVDAPAVPGTRLHSLKQAATTTIQAQPSAIALGRIAETFEQEWHRLQRQGIRRFIPPELRETYDALPSGPELVNLVRSVSPGSGEAQSLLDYNEAANRFVDRVGEGDTAGAQQAAADALAGLAGSVPLVGSSVRGTRSFEDVATAGRTAKKAASIPSKRPLQVVLDKTPGRNEQGRLRQIREQVRRTLPSGFLDQTAAQAIAKTHFPPRDPRENVRRGLAAADLVIEQTLRGEPGVLADAMFRKDVGSIALIYGQPGNPAKKYKKGGGLSHIIAKHGAEVVDDLIETLAKGVQVRQEGAGAASRSIISHRGHIAVLSLYHSGTKETWLLTGYKTGISDINFDLSQLRGPIFFNPS